MRQSAQQKNSPPNGNNYKHFTDASKTSSLFYNLKKYLFEVENPYFIVEFDILNFSPNVRHFLKLNV